ncbi:MAG: ASCH domain-containing protein [Steroidobacteraceae bacterium]|nr:ASCH domain-containing protein [Steroidobacteraceae bacterium]MDW8259088.1 ASCH domain-containing protein [Gammaproteobacteria bacterium]
MVLPPGPRRPEPAALERFWAAARAALPDVDLGETYQVRWIGLDAPTTRQIFELIRARDKTGTFTLPWIVERTDQRAPRAGDALILIDYDGTPTLLVRLTAVRQVLFGDIGASDIAVDGSPVRDLAIWKPMHIEYWNALLAPFGLRTSDDMPVWIETFELLFDRDSALARRLQQAI